MLEIQAAHVRGVEQINGRACAEVEVIPFDSNMGSFTVYVAKVPNGGYEIVETRTYQTSNQDSGAYDNNMGQALSASFGEEMAGIDFGAEWQAKAYFLDNLLGCAEVCNALDKQLGE